MLEIICIEFDVMTNDVLQQSRHTHPVLTDFASELIKHLPQLATDEYGLAVFNLVGLHKGVAILLQREFALLATHSALNGGGWWLLFCNGSFCFRLELFRHLRNRF